MGRVDDSELSAILECLRSVFLDTCLEGPESALDVSAQVYRFEQRIRSIALECARIGRDHLLASLPDDSARTVDVDKWAGDQIARGAGLNCRDGHRFAQLAGAHERLEPALRSLAAGDIDYSKLTVLFTQCDGLSDEKALAVQEKVLAKPPRCSTTDFRRRTHHQVLRIDPRTAAQRREAATRKRKVVWRPESDGQASLTIHGPAEELRPIHDTILRRARNTAKKGRTCDAVRYDITRDILRGDLATTSATATLNVTVDFATLLGLDNRPAELHGHGPVVADVARELAKRRNTYLRRLTTIDGKLVHLSDRYRPTRSQADYCRLRDPICPWPGCNHPAGTNDLDHGKPYRTTGITDTGDLVGWCRRHHLLKTLGYFDWIRNPDDTFTITLHTGETFTTESDHPQWTDDQSRCQDSITAGSSANS